MITRRTFFKALATTRVAGTFSPLAMAALTQEPAPSSDLYIWLHGLTAIVIGRNNIRILSPSSALNHLYLFGRVVDHNDPLAGLKPLDDWYFLEGISHQDKLPARDGQFQSFVLENISHVRYDLSRFVLTLPYPDEIIPLRIVKIRVLPLGNQKAPIGPGNLPLLPVFHYKNIDPRRVSIGGLWNGPGTSNGPIHLHIYVEPDPKTKVDHDPQQPLAALVNLFPGVNKFKIPTQSDQCSKPNQDPRHCHQLGSVPPTIQGALQGSAGVIEQLDLWEWVQKCDVKVPPCAPQLTYESGICPPGFAILKGVAWTS